jgi:hypothetical protein
MQFFQSEIKKLFKQQSGEEVDSTTTQQTQSSKHITHHKHKTLLCFLLDVNKLTRVETTHCTYHHHTLHSSSSNTTHTLTHMHSIQTLRFMFFFTPFLKIVLLTLYYSLCCCFLHLFNEF